MNHRGIRNTHTQAQTHTHTHTHTHTNTHTQTHTHTHTHTQEGKTFTNLVQTTFINRKSRLLNGMVLLLYFMGFQNRCKIGLTESY